MHASNIFHLGIKELRSLLRDPVMLFLIFFAFTFAIYTGATACPRRSTGPIAFVGRCR